MNSTRNTAMTDAERLALASRLDNELDAFIDSLPKREKAIDDNLLEDLENHPFFMKKAPEATDRLHPLYEGLQQLKYDPSENTPQELAASYKDDGNFNFQHKNYRLAVIAYTEGLKALQQTPESNFCNDLESTLYNNRSAAHWFLQNYRSSLRDAQWALKRQPRHWKAMKRAANCCLRTQNYDLAMKYCDQMLDISTSAEILDLRKHCLVARKTADLESRKKDLKVKKQLADENQLLEAIRGRGIQIMDCISLQPLIPTLIPHVVHLTSQQELVWPVIFMYPEHKTMDFIIAFNENETFEPHLQQILQETPAWDVEKQYKTQNIHIYFEYAEKQRVKRVHKSQTLKTVLADEMYVVEAGTPCFLLLVHGSHAENAFLSNYC